MSLYLCGGPMQAVDLPDAGQGYCCEGAVYQGQNACTCWEPVYDLEQVEPVAGLVPGLRTVSCGDCAYRPDSPERAGAEGYAANDGELDEFVVKGQPFWCHQGIKRIVGLRHPSGVEIAGHAASYDPPIIDRVPFRADGTAAEICAGWAARRLAFVYRGVRDEPLVEATA